jgi:hypothetical protein
MIISLAERRIVSYYMCGSSLCKESLNEGTTLNHSTKLAKNNEYLPSP